MTPSIDFHGFVFLTGYELLPGVVILDPNSLRQWALREGLVTNPDIQLLVPQKLQELSKCFSSDDGLQIALAIYEGDGGLTYFEYPSLPVRTLIRLGKSVRVSSWWLGSKLRDKNNNVVQQVGIRFMYPGCNLEMCTLSTSKRIGEKLGRLLDQLSDAHPIKTLKNGYKEIAVNGVVQAEFIKDGRSFDVNLTVAY